MLSKLSVKKPYTVVVAIVLVLILGGVSSTRMNTDLLPSMDLPYAIVMTTYPGANPETVEMAVTEPIEQSMATVSSVENVSSTSQENMSMVVLEFEETANMDSATIEMRENLDQISSYWDDSVGNPIIMKLNPDMMPIMIAAVEIEGFSDTEITDYVSSNIEPELESIAGVASVSTVGAITESVDIIIRQEKIDQINQRINTALEKTFQEQREDLEEAQEEIDDSRVELEEGKTQLEEGENQLVDQIGQVADAQAQLTEGELQLAQAQTQIDANRQTLESQKISLETQRSQLAAGVITEDDTYVAALAEFHSSAEYQAAITAAESAANQAIEQSEEVKLLEDAIAAWENSGQGSSNQAQEARNQLDQLKQTMVNTAVSEAESQALEGFRNAYAQAAVSTLDDYISQIDSGLSQLDIAQAQLDATRTELNSGKITMAQAQAQLESAQVSATIEMASAKANLTSGESQLESAQTQLDEGRKQLDDAREEALEQSNLNNIVTVDMVKNILSAQNFSMPAGYVTENTTDYLVRVGDKLQDVDNLRDLVLLDLDIDGLEPIKLADVSDVAVSNDSDEIYANLNGNPGVMLSMEKQTGYSTGEVTDRILERFEQLKIETPDMGVSILMDQGIYIDMVVDSVLQNMIFGAILAIIILLLFLKDVRPTLVIACSIPISVVAALVLMYFSGVTLNLISLSGLALGVGMLVDNSIVVIENIFRMRNNGVPPRKAAVEGTRQVAGAIAASTLTTACVFLPIVFTEGITRQLFVDMGLTIAYSLLASLVVALTLVPMMSAGVLKETIVKKTPLLDKIYDGYGKLLKTALKFKPIVMILAVILLVVSTMAAMSRGTAFMPEMESTQASVTVSVDKDKSFEDLTKASDEVIEKIQDIEDIESIGAMAGGTSMTSLTGGSGDTVSMYLVLNEDRKLSNDKLESEILSRTESLDCQVEVTASSMDMSALGGTGINVRIKGRELDELQQISKEVAALVKEVPGTANVSDGLEDTDEEFRVVVNKVKAMEYNLTVAQVFQTINEHLAEASSATTLSTATKDYDVYVFSEKDENLNRQTLEDMELSYTNSEGESKKVKLNQIATFEDATSPQAINRDAQSRYIAVSAELEPGYNIGLVSSDVEEKLTDYQFPEGYTMEMTGEDETINEAMGQLVLMLLLAIVFMYLIMVAQFQSLLSPFIVMFTIPLAFTGGFMALFLTGNEVSVIAMIGFVMLAGIIVNNGIVLVDYINQLRMDGMEKKRAIVEAGKSRLRPIVMTALTTILAMSTMAVGMGMGADMVQPMAIVTIGGLLYGTVLTLFVVPCIYDVLNRKNYKRDESRLEDANSKEIITQ